ncbi:MAG TPA: cellulase family glycosylhydrolase [Pyrinomonadaceae bacterium]|nr:cellulase family glycosylhydrolase [Pyrinomonadaceae bacterium]
MNIKKISFLIVLFTIFSLGNFAQSPFVKVKDHQFYIGEKSYYFIGTNYWYGTLLGLEKDKKRGIERLRKELDFLKANGVTNLRIMAGAEGSGLINGVTRVGPALQPVQGKFNVEMLDGLDIILAEMGKRNLKAIVFFSNNWEWSGGFQQYLIWNNLVPKDQETRKLTWDEQRDIVSKFYGCEPCKTAYNEQVNLILNRTNKITKKKYINDPAIMAWELANEPRPMRPTSNETYKKWIADVSAMIKAKDKNHLVTLGHEGLMGTENMPLFEEIHRDTNVDYLTIHVWAKNWGWFKDDKIAEGYSNVVEKATNYVNEHLAVAKKLNKPLVIEEFGLPRNGQSFDIHSSTSFRDDYYSKMFAFVSESAKSNGALAGANFWAFGGTSRPTKGQIFWKKGDDYMGDPPMEEQGLNTVFDSDKTTWEIINKYSKMLH